MRSKRFVIRSAELVASRSQRDENISYFEQYNCWPPPVFMLLITAAEIGVYTFYAVTMHYPISLLSQVPVRSPLIYDPCKRQEAWRYVSYVFIHTSICHILFNSVAQLVLGIPLELVHKFWRVGLVYLLGVLAGSLAVSITDPHLYLAGASGGCYALMAAHFSNLVVNWNEMECAIQQLVCLILLLAADIAVAFYNRYADMGGGEKTTQRISYAAHVGGLIAGLLMGIVVLRNFKQKTWERVVWWMALVAFSLGVISCVLWNVYCPQCCQ